MKEGIDKKGDDAQHMTYGGLTHNVQRLSTRCAEA